MLIKLTVTAVLRALSLCGMGGFLAYVYHTDIKQLEQGWRRKTLPQSPQNLEPQVHLEDARAPEGEQTKGTPSYRIYEVFEQREQTYIPTTVAIPSPHGPRVPVNADFSSYCSMAPNVNYNWFSPVSSSITSAPPLLAYVAIIFAGFTLGFWVRHFCKPRRRSSRTGRRPLPAVESVVETSHPAPTSLTLDALQYQAICAKLDQLIALSQHGEANASVIKAAHILLSGPSAQDEQQPSPVSNLVSEALRDGNPADVAERHLSSPESEEVANACVVKVESKGKATANAEERRKIAPSEGQANGSSSRVNPSSTLSTNVAPIAEEPSASESLDSVLEGITEEDFEDEDSQPAPGTVNGLIGYWCGR